MKKETASGQQPYRNNAVEALRADLWLVLITVIWSGTFALIKLALRELPPFHFTALRFGIALVVSLLLWARTLRTLTRQRVCQGLVLGLLFGVGFYLQTIGLVFTSVGNSAFITGALVVLTPFAYWLVERKPISFFHRVGVGLAFVGLWIFIRPATALNVGDGLTFISALGWALYITYLDVFTRNVPRSQQWTVTGQLVILQFGVTAVLGAILAGVFESAVSWQTLSLPTIGAVLYTAILASVVATGIQTHHQHRTTPVRAALIFALEPILAALLGVWLLDEPFDHWHAVGGTMVILGILWAEIGEMLWQKVQQRLPVAK